MNLGAPKPSRFRGTPPSQHCQHFHCAVGTSLLICHKHLKYRVFYPILVTYITSKTRTLSPSIQKSTVWKPTIMRQNLTNEWGAQIMLKCFLYLKILIKHIVRLSMLLYACCLFLEEWLRTWAGISLFACIEHEVTAVLAYKVIGKTVWLQGTWQYSPF